MRYIMNGPLRKKIHNKKIIHVYCCHTDKNVRLSGTKHIQDTQLSYQYQHNIKVNQKKCYARPSVVYIMHGIGEMTHFFTMVTNMQIRWNLQICAFLLHE